MNFSSPTAVPPDGIRNICNAATVLKTIAPCVSEWQMWRNPPVPQGPTGRMRGVEGAGTPAPQRMGRLPPRRRHEGAGITPLLPRPQRPPPPHSCGRWQRGMVRSDDASDAATYESNAATARPRLRSAPRSTTADT